MIKQFILIFGIIFLASCSSLLKYEKKGEEFKNQEFEKKVVILETEEGKEMSEVAAKNATEASSEVKPVKSEENLAAKKTKKKSKVTTKSKGAISTSNETVAAATRLAEVSAADVKSAAAVSKPAALVKSSKTKKEKPQAPGHAQNLQRQPDSEDAEGFNNQRRPPVDPFWVGESVTHEVSYLGAKAGTLVLKVNPFAVVNGRKSYNFIIELKSASFFSKVFAVDDKVQTYVDFENLVPHVFKLDIRDSVQVKEAQAYFDNHSLNADYWEHRYTEKGGHEEKKLNWSILPYSQNPFSAIFYMRVFKFVLGKDYSFRVADDEKNVTFKAHALEKTKLSTDAGDFKAIKLKAEIYSHGNLAKASDFYIWISDDDRKYILRIEVRLPFGSIVSEAKKIIAGKQP